MLYLTKPDNIIGILGVSALISIFSIVFSSNSLMALGAFLAGLAGAILLSRNFVYVGSRFRFTDVLSASILLATGLGTVITYTSFETAKDWNSFLNQRGILDSSTVVTAQLAVDLFCLCLFLLGLFTRRRALTKQSSSRSLREPTPDSKLLLKVTSLSKNTKLLFILLWSGFLVSSYQIYLLFTGKFGFLWQGLAKETEEDLNIINPEIQLLLVFVPPIIFVLGFLLLKLKEFESNNLAKLLYLSIAITQLMWFITIASRREFAFSALIFLFGVRISLLGKPIKFSLRNIFRLAFITVMVIVIAFLGIQITSFMRFLLHEGVDFKSQSITENFSDLAREFFNYFFGNNETLFNLGEFESKLSQNLSTRPFVLSGFAMILERLADEPLLLGEDLSSNFLKSIPGFLFPGKYSLLTLESLYRARLDISEAELRDLANSFYLSAFADFSWLGLFIYPVIIYVLLNLMLKITLKSNSMLFHVLVTGSLFKLGLSGGELALIGLFVNLRDLLIFLIIITVFRFFLHQGYDSPLISSNNR